MAKGETVWLQKYLEIEWPHIGLEDWGRRGGWDWYYNNNNNNYDSNNTNKPRYIKKRTEAGKHFDLTYVDLMGWLRTPSKLPARPSTLDSYLPDALTK